MNNDWGPKGRYDDRKEEETPPYSRLFVVCSKTLNENDLREPFEKFGEIESLRMPRDRNTGQSKGIAYIKYAKTSSAAAAIQTYHMKKLNDKDTSKVKVMIACNRNEHENNINEEKFKRLFIKVAKSETESDVKSHFESFNNFESLYFLKNKGNDEHKGFAYVSYGSFYDTAIAFEQCDRKYKAVFATPKDELKRNRNNFEQNNDTTASHNNYMTGHSSYHVESYPGNRAMLPPFRDGDNFVSPRSDGFTRVNITVSPQLPQKYIESLCNIIPGMENIQVNEDRFNNISRATVTYADHMSALQAIEKLNNFEFPSGEIVIVKEDDNPIGKAASNLKNIVDTFKNAMDYGGSTTDLAQLADAIAKASSLIQAAASGQDAKSDSQDPNYCSVKLPPPQPIVENAPTALRCFVICKPQPPPQAAIKDVFRRFGNLIDVTTFPHKTFVFVRYASEKSARDAIQALNGATVCGIRLKVMEADEKHSDNNDKKRMRMDVDEKCPY